MQRKLHTKALICRYAVNLLYGPVYNFAVTQEYFSLKNSIIRLRK